MTFTLKHFIFALLSFGTLLITTSCSKDEVEPAAVEKPLEDPVITQFAEVKVLDLPNIDKASFTPRALRVKGDTLIVANNNPDDRSVYLFSLNENKMLGKISNWIRDGIRDSFNSEIGDIAVSAKFIFVGLYTSRIYVFERKTLKYVNVIGCNTEGWGGGVYQMVHCYGMRVWDDNLMVRDKESIRAYRIYDAITELAFRVPWFAKYKGKDEATNQSQIGYDYNPVQHGMVAYNGSMYVDDSYLKSIQKLDLSKMILPDLGQINLKVDSIISTGTSLDPRGLVASGGSLFISDFKTGALFQYSLNNGTLTKMVEFSNRKVGRMELIGRSLYFIDTKSGAIVLAHGS